MKGNNDNYFNYKKKIGIEDDEPKEIKQFTRYVVSSCCGADVCIERDGETRFCSKCFQILTQIDGKWLNSIERKYIWDGKNGNNKQQKPEPDEDIPF